MLYKKGSLRPFFIACDLPDQRRLRPIHVQAPPIPFPHKRLRPIPAKAPPIPFPCKRQASETKSRPPGDTVFDWTPAFAGVVWWQLSRKWHADNICGSGRATAFTATPPSHSRESGNPVRQRVARRATPYLNWPDEQLEQKLTTGAPGNVGGGAAVRPRAWQCEIARCEQDPGQPMMCSRWRSLG